MDLFCSTFPVLKLGEVNMGDLTSVGQVVMLISYFP